MYLSAMSVCMSFCRPTVTKKEFKLNVLLDTAQCGSDFVCERP